MAAATDVEKQQAVQKYETIKKMFLKDDVKKRIQQVIPQFVNAQRLFEVSVTMLRENQDLLKCSQESLIAGIMGILKLGLDPVLKQVHLVPFWNGRTKRFEAQMIIDYKGYLVLARRSGEVADVSVGHRHEKDHWRMVKGTTELLEHIPAEGERGEYLGSYVVFFFKDGGKPSFEYMTKGEIDKRKGISQTGKKDEGPWKDWEEEMRAKTVLRHHIKYIPVATEDMQRASELDDRSVIGETQLDLLPDLGLGAETGQEVIQANPAAVFDERANRLIPTEDYAFWNNFLNETASLNKVSVEEMKASYKDDLEKLVQVFTQKYKPKMLAKHGKPEATKPVEDAPVKAETKTGDAAPPTGKDEAGPRKDLFGGQLK